MRAVVMFAYLALAILPAQAQNLGTIVVHVDKINNNKGVLRLALFNNEAAYSADKNTAAGALRKEVGKIDGFESTCSFKDLPYGEYAIKLYHDEKNNGVFKKNFMRVPCVQFGFSNNAKAIFPPSYKKAKFALAASELKMTIHMDQR